MCPALAEGLGATGSGEIPSARFARSTAARPHINNEEE
jgi:hypothetical protein